MPLTSTPLNAASPFASMKGDHVGLRVPDLDDALAWYGEKLDFRIMDNGDSPGLEYTWLAPANDDSFRLELLVGPGSVQRTGFDDDLAGSLSLDGFNHIGLSVGSVDDAVMELKQRDVRILLEPIDNPALQVRVAFFADPWGNVFELVEHKTA